MSLKCILQGQQDESKIFWAEYQVTTAPEIYAAYADGKMVLAKIDGIIEYLYSITNGIGIYANCHFARLVYNNESP